MEKLKQLIPTTVWDYTPAVVIAVGTLVVIKKVGFNIAMYISKRRCLNKFKITPKDVVILHMIPRGRTMPSPSPFVLKLETYFRMTNIPYQVDTEYGFGPTKKTPWITLNGQHMGDSQLIIEFLTKKFDKQLGASYTPKQLALGRMARVLVEDELYWGGFLWRYYYRAGQDLHKIFSNPALTLPFVRRRLYSLAKTATFYHGIGRHSKETVLRITMDNLRALSLFIGDKKFLLGDEPCTEDAAVFGFLAQVLFSCPGDNSQAYNAMQGELINLKNYTIRMKELYWPDWDNFLVK